MTINNEAASLRQKFNRGVGRLWGAGFDNKTGRIVVIEGGVVEVLLNNINEFLSKARRSFHSTFTCFGRRDAKSAAVKLTRWDRNDPP